MCFENILLLRSEVLVLLIFIMCFGCFVSFFVFNVVGGVFLVVFGIVIFVVVLVLVLVLGVVVIVWVKMLNLFFLFVDEVLVIILICNLIKCFKFIYCYMEYIVIIMMVGFFLKKFFRILEMNLNYEICIMKIIIVVVIYFMIDFFFVECFIIWFFLNVDIVSLGF